VFQSLAGLAPPYLADDCRLVSLTDRHLRSADTRTCVVSEQILGSGTEVSQPPVQKYGTVCRLQSALRQLRDGCFYGCHITPFYACMYVCIYVNLLAASCSGAQDWWNKSTSFPGECRKTRLNQSSLICSVVWCTFSCLLSCAFDV